MITAVTERLRQPAMIFTRFYPFVRISMSNIRFMMKTNIYHCQTLEKMQWHFKGEEALLLRIESFVYK